MKEFEPLFRTTDGLIIPKDYSNRHHCLWRKDWYKTPTERKVREMGGLVVRLNIKDHRELHRNVEPPIKPSAKLLSSLYQYNMHNLETLNSYDRFEAISEYLGKVAAHNGPHAEEAEALHDNFEQQLIYVQDGRLEIYHGE